MEDLSAINELFLTSLEIHGSIKATCKVLDMSNARGYALARELSEEIVTRAREKLSVSALQAVGIVVDLLEADGSIEKGELRLKAAESVLDRTGVTKHTNVDVIVEADNGIFILPGKDPVTADPSSEYIPEDTQDT